MHRQRVEALPPSGRGAFAERHRQELGADSPQKQPRLKPRFPQQLDPMEGRRDYSRKVVSAQDIRAELGGYWDWAIKPPVKPTRRWSAGAARRDFVKPTPSSPMSFGAGEGIEKLGGRFLKERLKQALRPVDLNILSPQGKRVLRSAPSSARLLGWDGLEGPIPLPLRVPLQKLKNSDGKPPAPPYEEMWGECGPRLRAPDGRSKRVQLDDRPAAAPPLPPAPLPPAWRRQQEAVRASLERRQGKSRKAHGADTTPTRTPNKNAQPRLNFASPSKENVGCSVVDDLEGLPAEIAAARLERKAKQKQVLGFQMIIDGVFLGPASVASRKESLLDAGITHILNATDTEPCSFPEAFVYTRIAVQDTVSENIGAHFDKACRFIRDAVTTGGRVYVHCVAGVSRSASFVMCYLMRARNMTLLQAFKHVKSERSCVQPNEGFWVLLEKEDIRLHGSSSCTLHQYKARILCEAFPTLTAVEVEAELVKAGGDISAAALQLSQME